MSSRQKRDPDALLLREGKRMFDMPASIDRQQPFGTRSAMARVRHADDSTMVCIFLGFSCRPQQGTRMVCRGHAHLLQCRQAEDELHHVAEGRILQCIAETTSARVGASRIIKNDQNFDFGAPQTTRLACFCRHKLVSTPEGQHTLREIDSTQNPTNRSVTHQEAANDVSKAQRQVFSDLAQQQRERHQAAEVLLQRNCARWPKPEACWARVPSLGGVRMFHSFAKNAQSTHQLVCQTIRRLCSTAELMA